MKYLFEYLIRRFIYDPEKHLPPKVRDYVGEYNFRSERNSKIFLFVLLVAFCIISIAGLGLAGFQIYREKKSLETFLLIIFCLPIFGFSVYGARHLYLISITNIYAKCKFAPCSSSMVVRLDWQCSWCGNHQGEGRWIFRRCVFCKRFLDYFRCEHCKNKHKIV